eukprot:GHVS01015067.1.p1 GENE.GHVS01015067.1~~GHVS01015067.1.p1  ORF type:complete len:522 (+),score=96.56 GHVS01015067.1:223-1788(+)
MSLSHRSPPPLSFHVSFFLLVLPFFCLALLSSPATADSTPASGPPAGSCPSCNDCSVHADATAVAEDRLAKMGSELNHLKQINEESVKACNLVSQKQVESLEECQKSQQQLGTLFNKAQEEKQELNAKVDSLTKENIEQEHSCVKRVEAVKAVNSKKLAEAESKVMAAEQAGASKEEAEKIRTELSGQLDGAAGRISQLMEETKKNDNEHRMFKEAAAKVEAGLKAELISQQKKSQTAEKSFQQAQSQLNHMRREIDSLKEKSDQSSPHLYSFQSFRDSCTGLRNISVAVVSSLFTRIPQNYKDSMHQTYTEYRLAFVDPLFAHPTSEQVFRMASKQLATIKGLYDAHLGGERGHVATLKKKVSSAMDGAQSKADEWNEALNKRFVNQFLQEHPEVERLIPIGVWDRLMCCCFVLFSFFVCYKLLILVAVPLTHFAICQVCGCRFCARRDTARAAKRVHSTKKRLTSPTAGSSSAAAASGQRKKPTESVQPGGSGKAFRPDESSGSATTTSSSSGNGMKRK